MNATVYRPVRNRLGEYSGDLSDHEIGEVTGLIPGAAAVSPTGRNWPAMVDTEGLLSVPRDQAVTLQKGDLLAIGGVLHEVVGPHQWDYPSGLTGHDFARYWVEVRASH